MNCRIYNFDVFGDARGKLISLEEKKNIPFEIKRVYYIFDTVPDEVRGKHAHKNLEQIIIAIDGSCRFVLDDGKKRKDVWLNRPDVGLYIGKNMWREMHDFSYGCKLLVLASAYYDENEYIRDYEVRAGPVWLDRISCFLSGCLAVDGLSTVPPPAPLWPGASGAVGNPVHRYAASSPFGRLS